MEYVTLIAGIILGAGICYILLRNSGKSRESLLQSRLDDLNNRLKSLQDEMAMKENALLELTRDSSFQKAENKSLIEKLQEQKQEFLKLNEHFSTEFRNLANEILEEKTKKFTEQNKTNLDTLLKPLSEKIKDFEKKVEETYDKESKQRFHLSEEVRKLAELNKIISEEASNLTRALKADSKTQGNWGEMILESILEKSGLSKGREYHVQQTFKDEEGNDIRPDVIVEYPGQRYVVVDSKVSLSAFERYASATEEEEKAKALKEHLQSVRNHVNGLSQKAYQEIYGMKSLDFIMLFMPVEPAYMLAVQHDPELWNFAYNKRILIIGPTNLIAALKMISSLWQQEYQNRNAREIAKKSSDLLDKFYNLLKDLEDLGSKLRSTRSSYDEIVKKLSSGKGNLIKRAKDIEELGAKSVKTIPRAFEEGLEEED